MVVGPFRTVNIGGGASANLYILRYGPDGALLSPQTERLLKDELTGATDVFLFSHGWNNTFDDAAAAYQRFVDGYVSQAAAPAGHHPVLVGVVWPSISFLMPWEDGPQIAADPQVGTARVEEMRAFVAGTLPADRQARLSEAIDGRTQLPPAEAREAAAIVREALLSGSDPDDGSTPPTLDELMVAWAALDGGEAAKPADPDRFGDVGRAADPAPDEATGPGIAAGFLDPRNLLRMGTVWKMKDRAGTVGGRGVAPLIRHILAGDGPRLHLIGHSFGARLLLSALTVAAPARPARSMLLLQPAVNRWCFADKVIDTGRAGGYRPALDHVELPILASMSSHDLPLHDAFHLAVRGSSLGEPNILAFGDTERYGALGGYGPAGLDARARRQPAIAAGAGTYDLSGGVRVVAVDGSGDLGGKPAIGGHGDINTPTTWWALHCLTSAP